MVTTSGAATATAPPRTRSALPVPLLVAAILAPALVVFVLPMVQLIARNGEHFDGDYLLGRTIFGVGAVAALLGLGAWALSGRLAGRFLWIAYLLLAPAYVVASFFAGFREGRTAAVVGAALLVASALLAWRGTDRALRGVAVVTVVVLIASAVGVLGAVLAGEPEPIASGPPAPPDTTTSRPPDGNVYHVVLDEMQTELFEQVLDERQREALAGFTWYPEARTAYGRTEMSMASVFAPADYDYARPPADYVDDALRGPGSGMQRLRAAGFSVTADVPASNLYGERNPFDQTHLPAALDVSSSAGDADLAASMWVYGNVPESVAVRLVPARYFEQLDGGNLVPDTVPVRAVEAAEAFIAREPSEPATGRYSLLHLMLPHFPYVLDDDCSSSEGQVTGPVEQTTCAMSLVDQLIDELHLLDRFDDSTIIVQGDHGARFAEDDGELVPLREDLFGEPYSGARSRPLLLVKPAGRTAEVPFTEDRYPAMLTDVVPTILDSVGAPVDPAPGRTSLLAADRPTRSARTYHFYDKDSKGLPDGVVTTFIVHEDGSVTRDRVIELPG